MSGGSFNYLCFKDATNIFSGELREMAAALDEYGHQARDVAYRTRALLARREDIEREISALADVWRAVEWHHSADSSREDVYVALGAYRERQRSEGTER